MSWIEVDQFRSTFVGDEWTLIAELTSAPRPRWRECCLANLERYASAFGQIPRLHDDTLVVPVNALEIALAEAALMRVVEETNRRVFESDDV